METNDKKPVKKQWRRQDCPRYKEACDIAAEATRRIDERWPFEDEDEYREYYRELREDIYFDSGFHHDYY